MGQKMSGSLFGFQGRKTNVGRWYVIIYLKGGKDLIRSLRQVLGGADD